LEFATHERPFLGVGRGSYESRAWSFSEAHTLPFRLGLLPIEEWLFFPVVGFIAIFLWEVVGYYQRRHA